MKDILERLDRRRVKLGSAAAKRASRRSMGAAS